MVGVVMEGKGRWKVGNIGRMVGGGERRHTKLGTMFTYILNAWVLRRIESAATC